MRPSRTITIRWLLIGQFVAVVGVALLVVAALMVL